MIVNSCPRPLVLKNADPKKLSGTEMPFAKLGKLEELSGYVAPEPNSEDVETENRV